MKDNKICKIVQDLLPNYVEKLTNEETNSYIEEHLEKCAECRQMLENMQKDLEMNKPKRDFREIKYIKKFNRKFKILRNILIIIILLIAIVVGRKMFIITSLSNKAQETQNKDNYLAKIEIYSEGKMTVMEAYCKGDKTLVNKNSYSEEQGKIKQILYKSREEKFSLTDNGETKEYQEIGDISVKPTFFTSNKFFENLFMAFTTSVDKVEIKGKECYIVRNDNTEKFIDVNTGLAIKMIDNESNLTADYKYEFGIVTDEDVLRPDTTEYMK